MAEPDEYLTFGRGPSEHRDCRALAQHFADRIAETDPEAAKADVTVAPQPAGTDNVICPRGVRYWLVPVEAGG
jgi:hypothetical protein